MKKVLLILGIVAGIQFAGLSGISQKEIHEVAEMLSQFVGLPEAELTEVLTENTDIAEELHYAMVQLQEHGSIEQQAQSLELLKQIALTTFVGSGSLTMLPYEVVRLLRLLGYGVSYDSKTYALFSKCSKCFSYLSMIGSLVYTYAQFKLWRLGSKKSGSAEKLMEKFQTAVAALGEKVKEKQKINQGINAIDNI